MSHLFLFFLDRLSLKLLRRSFSATASTMDDYWYSFYHSGETVTSLVSSPPCFSPTFLTGELLDVWDDPNLQGRASSTLEAKDWLVQRMSPVKLVFREPG